MFIDNISIVVISQLTHVFGLSEINRLNSYADKCFFTKIHLFTKIETRLADIFTRSNNLISSISSVTGIAVF